MKRSSALLGLCLPVLLAMQPATKPATKPAAEHQAIVAYLNYVKAIRSGDIDKAIASVEAVPADCMPALTATIHSAIALESFRAEMTTRFGAPKAEHEDWGMSLGQLPDDILKSLRVEGEQAEGAVLVIKNAAGDDGTAAVMVRRDGRTWSLPASHLFDQMPSAEFVAPSREDLARIIKRAEARKAVAELVLRRMRAGDFQDSTAMLESLSKEIRKVGG